jgi:hypothetical protein
MGSKAGSEVQECWLFFQLEKRLALYLVSDEETGASQGLCVQVHFALILRWSVSVLLWS